MIDRYKKETAQIHAPATLIEMTKAAMREEENRIRRGQGGQIAVSSLQAVNADSVVYYRRHSLRRWAYPVTAVAAVVILVSVSMAMRGVRSGDTMSGASEADMDMATTAEMTAEEEACAEMPAEMNSGVEDSTVSDFEKAENAEGAMKDSAATSGEAGAIEEMSEAPMADFAEDVEWDKEQENSARESEKVEMDNQVKEFRTREDGSVKIEAVKERPDFYDNSDAEDIAYEGYTFRVVEEKRGWAAYVETETGESYVIRGRIEDQRIFLQEAYDKLAEETEN